MFKINNKSFSQQRAALKPMKNVAIFEEEEEDQQELEAEEEEEDEIFSEDGDSICYSSGLAVTTHDSRNETMLLAQFLSTTGPEEYAKDNNKKQQQFKRASRLLSRLRKRPTMPVLRSSVTPAGAGAIAHEPIIKKNYIPLPVYNESSFSNNTTSNTTSNNLKAPTTTAATNTTTVMAPIIKSNAVTTTTTSTQTTMKKHHQPPTSPTQPQLRDSGIYSETASEKDSSVVSSSTISHTSYIPLPPLPPFLNDLQQFPHPPYQTKNPRRPVPLPPAIASAAIATACSPTITSSVRSVPEAALKRKSVRLRHVQVQTEMGSKKEDLVVVVPPQRQLEDRQACPHCRQVISGTTSNRVRRPSCPPALSSGPVKVIKQVGEEEEEGSTDAKALLAMIMNLKSQLAEEKQCRIKLEKAMYQKQSDDRREQLAREKDRWAGDCLWLNDRIALLPE